MVFNFNPENNPSVIPREADKKCMVVSGVKKKLFIIWVILKKFC